MNHKTIAKRLMMLIYLSGLCGLAIYLRGIPAIGEAIVGMVPEYAYCYKVWMCFLLLSGIPCYLVLFYGLRIAKRIKEDQFYTQETIHLLSMIGKVALGDVVFFLGGNIVLLLLNMNHPGMLLISLIADFIGVAIKVFVDILIALVKEATNYKEENELTI